MVKRLKLKANIMINKNKSGGFTFIELLIAMAIVMIIATIAIPSLRERRVSANEDVATQVLLKDAQFLEKWNTLTGHYSDKDDKSGCPNLPYRFSPESANISSAHYYLNGKYKGSSSNQNSCTGNTFSIKAIPICGHGQESKKSVSLENDGNIIRGVTPECIREDQIPPDEGNTIDDGNQDGDLRPDWEDDVGLLEFCKIKANQTAAVCNGNFCKMKDVDSNNYPQCSCAINPSGTLDVCKNEDDHCNDSNAYLFECQCVKKPNMEACKIIDPNYCTDVAGWSPEKCNPPDEDPCLTDPTSVACACETDSTGEKCTQCSIKANSCLTLCGGSGCSSSDDPCVATNTCKDTTYTEGSQITDGCGNQYTCQEAAGCNQNGTRDNPANYPQTWALTECGYFNEKPNPLAVDSATLDSKSLMLTCNKYICSNNGNGNSNQCSKKGNIPSGLGNGYWTQCYSGKCGNPAVPPLPYKSGDVIYNKDCTKKYKCLNAKECNSEIAPGEDSTVWSLTNQ